MRHSSIHASYFSYFLYCFSFYFYNINKIKSKIGLKTTQSVFKYVVQTLKIVPLIIYLFFCGDVFAQNLISKKLNNQTNQTNPNNPAMQGTVIPNLGEHLSLACMACHNQISIYPISGQNTDVLFEKINAFATDQTKKTIMHQLLKGYNTQELQAITEYYSAQKPNNYEKAEKDFIALQTFGKPPKKQVNVKAKNKD